MCYCHLTVQKCEDITSTSSSSGRHRRAYDKKDIVKIANILLSAKLYIILQRDGHLSFHTITCNHLLSKLKFPEFSSGFLNMHHFRLSSNNKIF